MAVSHSRNCFFVGIVLLTVSLHYQNVVASNILGVFTSGSPSHLIVHMSVAKALAERGHNVTVVTSYMPKVMHEKINHILIPVSPERQQELEETMGGMAKKNNNIFSTISHFIGSRTPLIDMQMDTIKDKRFKELYENPGNKFDVVIMGYFMNDFILGVGPKFKAPIIMSWLNSPNDFINHYVGNPSERSYVPNAMIPTSTEGTMTFLQRIQNTLMAYFFDLVFTILNFKMETFYNELFGNEVNFPTYQEVKKNVSLIFCNAHYTEGPIRPNVPALVEIGGIQVKETSDPLPKDIEKVLTDSKTHGAILFSLGSNLKGSTIPKEKVKMLFNALAKLKQNVIWKWDDLENTPGTAPNIFYKKWLPQDDILAHPNLKLFITHAGKGGVAEATYHGVPMLALPFFADQHSNAGKVVASGFAISFNLLHLDAATFEKGLNDILNNPIYKNNIQRFSKLYRDRPMTARQSVVYWTEYVIRHQGAAHMQSPLVHLNALQAMNLDVFALLFGVIFLIIYTIVWVFKKIIRLLCGRKCTKTSTSKKSKTKQN